jgi:hypothetical protein
MHRGFQGIGKFFVEQGLIIVTDDEGACAE